MGAVELQRLLRPPSRAPLGRQLDDAASPRCSTCRPKPRRGPSGVCQSTFSNLRPAQPGLSASTCSRILVPRAFSLLPLSILIALSQIFRSSVRQTNNVLLLHHLLLSRAPTRRTKISPKCQKWRNSSHWPAMRQRTFWSCLAGHYNCLRLGMEAFRSWLQSNLGIGPVIQDVLLFPLLAAFLVWAVGSVVLAILFLKVKTPERRARLRTVSTYVAVVLGAAVFSRIWLASIRQMAALFGDRTPEQIAVIQTHFNGGLYAILATAALVLLLRFLRKLLEIVVARAMDWAHGGRPIRFRDLDLISRDRIRDSILLAARGARTLLVILLLYIYVPLVLSFFPVTAPLADQLLDYVLRPAAEIAIAVIDYLPKLLYLVVLVLVAHYSLKALRFVLNAVGKGDLVLGGFDQEWADPTYKLMRILAVVFTLMIGYPYLPGAESESFRGFSLFVGALVTLGSTAAIGNMVSGVILTYTRAFRIGDRVQIGDAVGDVLAKSLFVTRLRTIKNEEITVPNGLVLGGQVVNYSNAAKRRELVLTTEVGIGYDVHWRTVEALLREAAVKTPGILPEPEPYIWPKKLGDFAVLYELHACTDRADKMARTYAALRRNTLDVLHNAGVEIMTPDVQALRDASRSSVPAENAPGAIDASRGIQVDVSSRTRTKQD